MLGHVHSLRWYGRPLDVMVRMQPSMGWLPEVAQRHQAEPTMGGCCSNDGGIHGAFASVPCTESAV